jgi:HEPN domain-containing protein
MPRDRETAAQAAEWFRHAKNDLVAARALLSADVFPETVAFHAQQAAEKALKAVLLAWSSSPSAAFPYTHDLAGLVSLCGERGLGVPDEVADSVVLTEYAVATRYPGPWEELSGDEAEGSIGLAEAVVAWAAEKLGNQE